MKKQSKTPAAKYKSGSDNSRTSAEPDVTNAFPIVGIGASAGGLAAFEAFFSGMPVDSDPDMAFVLVQHLAPDHKSILSDLVRRYTRMSVYEVEDGMEVQPNCAYIIPPDRDMAFIGSTLQLMVPAAPRGHRMPIDFFFRSLAQDQHERAIGIILSGTGSDGTLGIRAIKGEGGMVMAQSPGSTEYDGMPRSAISTGLVDFELPPNEMAPQVIAYVNHAMGSNPIPKSGRPPIQETSAIKIFVLLRDQIGHDFSGYKPSTIHRRIERRMAVHQIGSMENYVKYLQRTPVEIEALFRDLLIGVTSFFRDPDVFKALEEQIIPRIVKDRAVDDVIRIWVPGCSTGEEAFSIAILLSEYENILNRPLKVQIFATDIDEKAIAIARTGLYPVSIANDLSSERLSRYFSIEPGGTAYRVRKSIRDMLVFSEQDVARDPPFSKLDLISCRNLLIYLGADLQKKLIHLFHYALNRGGYLFLGTSETVGEFGDLFSVVDRKSKLHQRREDFHQSGLSRILPAISTVEKVKRQTVQGVIDPKNLSLREITEQTLLKEVASPAVLVNGHGDIFYLHGRTGRYLEPTPGESGISNVIKMAREGLMHDLSVTLHKADTSGALARSSGLRVKTNGDFTTVDLTVRPVGHDIEVPLYLVVFDEQQGEKATASSDANSASNVDSPVRQDSDQRIEALQQELRAKEEYLQATNEELETANEELRSSNEEMQSVNEELQSTNEELETSREELQSVNEELATVNTELHTKVADLSRANNDMNNLLAGTGIATVFVDHDLRILRFTPAATDIINLIEGDVGRPIDHIVSNLQSYNALIADIRSVLSSLTPKEAELQTTDGEWYNMRILPYRTIDNVIEGAVLTFVDISDRKQAEASLETVQSRTVSAVTQLVSEPLIILDSALIIASVNLAFLDFFGLEEKDVLGNSLYEIGDGMWDRYELQVPLTEALSTDSGSATFEAGSEKHPSQKIRITTSRIPREYGRDEMVLLAFGFVSSPPLKGSAS